MAGRLHVVLWQAGRAGEKAFTDYASPKFHIMNQSTGEVRDAVFVGVLAASNYTSADVPEEGAPTIILCQPTLLLAELPLSGMAA